MKDCFIGFKSANGMIDVIYCRNTENVAKLLHETYRNITALKALMKSGDIRKIGATPETTEYYVQYRKELGAIKRAKYESVEEYVRNCCWTTELYLLADRKWQLYDKKSRTFNKIEIPALVEREADPK